MHALLLIDLQNDFLPNGALAVAEGDQVIPIANQLLPYFDLVVATQDWHPSNHGSFAANQSGHQIGEVITLDGLPQILWPVHCVQESKGAALSSHLAVDQIHKIFYKGTNPTIDSYSGFFDNGHRKATGLGNYLKKQSVTKVYIMGLATDYCVQFSALDAQQLGFETYLIEDGCRGVNLKEGDVGRAIGRMKKAGIQVIQSINIRPLYKITN